MTVQDDGWRGALAFGLSQGGAADTRALAEGRALLGQAGIAVVEMAGMGGQFRVSHATRIALTGADMQATLDGAALAWNAVHRMEAGQVLVIGAARSGVYGYLCVGGGVETPVAIGSRSTHRASGLGHVLQAGDILPLGVDTKPERTGLILPAQSPSTQPIRIVPTAQTSLFSDDVLSAFQATEFTRSARGNRQGVALESLEPFTLDGGQSITSETIVYGDIQLPGDGTPVVLMADCQTTGGYPRIAAVLPCDMPRVAQAPVGAKLRFKLLTRQEGITAELAEHKARAELARKCVPILRDPASMQDLLSYQLISGAVSGDEEEW